ncbi:helix-turn-helix domain-containing protein [Pinisolibacter sp.]|uniref:helix-turn-helix domain-containing protein n=1 Tax=Pinisolibacter sp. TaxID=2172024 RepID=UPI002FDD2DCD
MSTPIDDAEIASRLRDILKLKGISLRDISDALEMPYRTVQNYMTGSSKIPATFVFGVCHILDVEPDFLLYGDFKPQYADLHSAVLEALDDCGSIAGYIAGPGTAQGVVVEVDGEKFLSLGWRLAAAVSEAYDRARRDRMAVKRKLSVLPFGKRDHSSEI